MKKNKTKLTMPEKGEGKFVSPKLVKLQKSVVEIRMELVGRVYVATLRINGKEKFREEKRRPTEALSGVGWFLWNHYF